MKKSVILTIQIVLIIFFFFLYAPLSYAITINEICPISDSSHLYEWVEIYNNTDDTVYLNDYFVEDATGKRLKWQGSELNPHQYILATASSTLNNDGDTVKLLKNADVVESVIYTGQYAQNESYARCPNESGVFVKVKTTSSLSENTNSCATESSLIPTLQYPTNTPIQTTVVSQQTYTNVYISEAFVYPQENDAEWIELYNANPYTLTLQNWTLDDISNGGSSPFTFSITIPANSYEVVTITKTMFNNSGDTIRLLDLSGYEKDLLVYIVSQKEKSIGRVNIGGSSLCIQNPTKGSQNTTCLTENTTKINNTETPSSSSQDVNTPLVFNAINQDLITASNDGLIATDSFNYRPVKTGEVKGAKSTSPKKGGSAENGFKTAQSFASTSFMFSWTNICYILIKLFKKYQTIKGA